MDKINSTLIRAYLDHNLLKRLKYLSIDTGVPVQQLLVEAAILLLRYHDRAHGLPAPMVPCPPDRPRQKTAKQAKNGGAR